MKELFKLCRSSNITWRDMPEGDHNNTVGEPGYFMHIDEFLQRHVLKSQDT